MMSAELMLYLVARSPVLPRHGKPIVEGHVVALLSRGRHAHGIAIAIAINRFCRGEEYTTEDNVFVNVLRRLAPASKPPQSAP